MENFIFCEVLSLNEPGASYEQKTIFRVTQVQKIWDKL